ncbi:unnamed protein product [Closterium sp. NIES-64]|nr:unnamed protein product [Closterium sp. NIES-64]
MGSDPWRTDARHGAGGDRGYRQDTGAYRSPDEGYRRREERSRGRGLEELFSGRQGDLDVDGEDEADMANKAQETDPEGEAKGDDEAQEEGAGGQRDMPTGVKEADPTQAGVAAEPSAAKADGKNGGRNQSRGEEKDGRRRSSGSRSPNPRQHRDEKCGGEASDGIAMGGTLAARARQIRGCSVTRGAKAAIARLIRGRRMTRGAEAVTARQFRGSAVTENAEVVRTRQIRGGITAGGAKGTRAHQIRITIMMGDAEMGIARMTRNGIMEGGGEARRARRIGVSDTRRAEETDIARRRGSEAGMEGRAVGLARLGDTGSVTKDMSEKEDRINAAAEGEAAG